MVYGTAATGAAIDGTVSVQDSTGRVISMPITVGSGQFSVTVTGMSAPFMLKATSSDGRTVLYSATAQAGRANVNPLTHLGLMRLAANAGLANPADLYATPASFASRLTASALQTETAQALARTLPAFQAQLPGAKTDADALPVYDPVASPFAVGDATDRLLDTYPITFSTADGVSSASQSDSQSGFTVQVVRSDTLTSSASTLRIVGEPQIMAGSTARYSAEATFQNGKTQSVPASWTLEGEGSVDSSGKFTAPAATVSQQVTLRAHWFDGTHAVEAALPLTISLPARPESLVIGGIAAGATLNPATDVALTAQVHWSDGSMTVPSVDWHWTGDASAVVQLSANGVLRTGSPTSDQPITVQASYTVDGRSVSAEVSLKVRKPAPQLLSARITGLADGQTTLAGDRFQLGLVGQWSDGSESALAVRFWAVASQANTPPRMKLTVSTTGEAASQPYLIAPSAGTEARLPDEFRIEANYTKGDGSSAVQSIGVKVKPLVAEPTGLTIKGVTALSEGASASYQALLVYSNGDTEDVTASVTWSSQNSALLAYTSAANFAAGRYASKPTTAGTATVSAALAYAYLNTSGTQVSQRLGGDLSVTVNWLSPTLRDIALPEDLDFLVPQQPVSIAVTAHYSKLGREWREPTSMATLSSSDSMLVSAAGSQVTAQAGPANASQSWVKLTASMTDEGSGAKVQATRLVTVGWLASVPKRLLAYPWSPSHGEVQFRAISSDGFLDDYIVNQGGATVDGYMSAATRRRLPFLSGLTDVVQSQPAGTAGSETEYVAAVIQGQVVVIRLEDLYDAQRPVVPLVLSGVTTAAQVGLVSRPPVGATAGCIYLYVRTTNDKVNRYRLPFFAQASLTAADIASEGSVTGTFSSIAAGSQQLLAQRTDGAVIAEGNNLVGQVGDPAGSSTVWHTNFQVQARAFSNNVDTVVRGNLTGVTQIWAEHDASLAATAANFQGWGTIQGTDFVTVGVSEIDGILSNESVKLMSLSGTPRGMTSGAFVQADGSVVYRTSTFISSFTNDIEGDTHHYAVASWLPEVQQIVAGRRQASASLDWPGRNNLALQMPIVRTANDQILYLDGRAVIDANAQTIVLR